MLKRSELKQMSNINLSTSNHVIWTWGHFHLVLPFVKSSSECHRHSAEMGDESWNPKYESMSISFWIFSSDILLDIILADRTSGLQQVEQSRLGFLGLITFCGWPADLESWQSLPKWSQPLISCSLSHVIIAYRLGIRLTLACTPCFLDSALILEDCALSL